MRRMVLACMTALSVIACEGPMGPEGPTGPQGDLGPAGPSGPAGTDVERFTGRSDGSLIAIALEGYGTFDDPPGVIVYETLGVPQGTSWRWVPSPNWSIEPLPPDYVQARLELYLPVGYWYYVIVIH